MAEYSATSPSTPVIAFPAGTRRSPSAEQHNGLDAQSVRDASSYGTSNIAFSDVALAQQFADQNIGLLRYVPLMGKWFVWDGKRWEMDVRLLARERAKETCRRAAGQCNGAKAAKLIASARTVSSVERLGQCDQRIVAVAEQ